MPMKVLTKIEVKGYLCVCVCVQPYCADIMVGNKVFSRDAGGGIWRLLWVSKYSCG